METKNEPLEGNKIVQTEFPSGAAKGPAVCQDGKGVVHRAVGNQVIPNNRDTLIMRTACGKHDISANAEHISDTNAVNFPDCH